jgi:hypothetical protein
LMTAYAAGRRAQGSASRKWGASASPTPTAAAY